jgi:hypothetical protein
MHGLTHVVGGPDPVPGLLPPLGDTLDDKIVAAADAFWKLDETSGTVAHDSSGNGHDLTAAGGYLPPTWGQPAGPPGTTSAHWGTTSTRVSSSVSEPLSPFTDDFTAGVWVNVLAAGGGVELLGQSAGGLHSTSGGWALLALADPPGPDYKFGAGSNTDIIYANNPIVFGTWYFVAVVRDAGAWKLYIDGLLQTDTMTTDPAVVDGNNTWLGNDAWPGHGTWLHDSLLSYAFIAGRVMSGAELQDLAETAAAGAAAGDGLVLTLGPDGKPHWEPATVEVEHGDLALDDTPVTGDASPYAGTPTSSSGWHLEAHVETIVLYDANPARFDVPSRKWVRVPFDTVRIWRGWEPVVDGPDTKEAWLPDDRGLTPQAKDGVLHVTADMAGDQTVTAWCSIEWPTIDYTKVPDDDPEPIHDDAYVRALRIVDVSHGYILRASPGSSLRRFFEWPINQPFDGTAEWVDYTSDNPYPIYPIWPGRPLTLPAPYPKMTEAMSGEYYAPRKTFTMTADLSTGDNLCLQAWQDTQWTLRLSTDTFRDAVPLVPAYLRRPYLSITFSYDPETIDHTTGKLL